MSTGQTTAIARASSAQADVRHDTVDTFATLAFYAATEAAFKFAFDLFRRVAEWERTGKRARKYRRRARTGHKLVDAISRVTADVLMAATTPQATGKVFRSLNSNAFNEDDPVKYQTFRKATEALTALGFLHHEKGQPRFRKGFGASEQRRGIASKWSATAKLIALAAQHGITTANIAEHFARDAPKLPKVPLRLRARSQGRGPNKERGKIIRRTRWPPGWERYADEVRELNEFLSGFTFEGAAHHHYMRAFNLGDDPDFGWQFGGRLYSEGTAKTYQNVKREQRRAMTINGEPVTEVDVRASHLTILYARIFKKPLPAPNPKDPYDLPGFPREGVKAWINASIGNGRPIGFDMRTRSPSKYARWPQDAKDKFFENTGQDLSQVAKCRDVGAAVIKVYPDLLRLTDNRDQWADLHFIEAQAVIAAMLDLKRNFSVPSLSVHDALIAPSSKADLVASVLSDNYHKVVGVVPVVRLKTASQA